MREQQIETPRGVTPDDANLIRESIARPEWFTGIFDRHFDGVSAFVRRRVGPDSAEEIVSETFTRAFRQRSRYDLSYSSARPWLLGIASNLMRNQWRTEKRRLAAYSRMPLDPTVIGEPRPPVSPELLERLASLSSGQREVLLLHALADLSYEEIGEALGIRVGTVRSRLSRARSRMAATHGAGLVGTTEIDGDTKEDSSA